jgi:squalene-hopene/tetraprenyl-beta-curcumene cyclase
MIANKDGGGPMDRAFPVSPRLHEVGAKDALEAALHGARDWLLDQQRDDGCWCGELEGDTILESEYILLMAFLGRERDPLCAKLAHYLHEQRRPEGGWSIYPGGPLDLSASVKAYFALKLVGLDPNHPTMSEAREAILNAGGAQKCNSFTRFYLALLGQMGYDETPSVPPELVLIPPNWRFSLYAMSAWTRTIVVPLSIISALQPVRTLAPEVGIAELFRADQPRKPARRTRRLFSWTNFFLGIDQTLKLADKVVPRSWRRRRVRAAEAWMIEHLKNSDGLGAIFPPMIYTVIALECLGHARDSHLSTWAMRKLDELILDEGDSARVQPCVSPVWDTAIATIALADAGLPGFHPALMRSVRWLIDNEVRTPGDWSLRRPDVEPSGWHFQYRNDFYPDIDDTAMVLLALDRSALRDQPEVKSAVARATDWMLAMQNRDGGWAAFDVDIDNQVLTKVPFADHNAMLDPSCADITARVLEALGGLGYKADHPAVARGLEYLWSTQEKDGSWYGRWGVNYIYGTWQVLLGLEAIGIPTDHPAVRRAVGWLEATQQEGGGWGESCASYEDETLKAMGEPTASQTAWAVLGLLAAGEGQGEAVRRGMTYLAETQNAAGTWDETAYTGTGFPLVFYLKYHLYRHYFPLLALSRGKAAGVRLAPPWASAAAYACRVPALPLAVDY